MAGLSIRCDASSFGRLQSRARGWDGTLDAQLRAELNAAAKGASRSAQRAALRLRLPGQPPAARPRGGRSTGLRSGLSRSVEVVLASSGGGEVDYRITSRHRMAKPTNATSFRHPVFGNRDNWVTQKSQPWWDLSMRTSKPAMQQAAERALDRAVRRL